MAQRALRGMRVHPVGRGRLTSLSVGSQVAFCSWGWAAGAESGWWWRASPPRRAGAQRLLPSRPVDTPGHGTADVTGAEVLLAAPLAVALGVAGGLLIDWLLHRFGWVVSVPVASVLAVIMYADSSAPGSTSGCWWRRSPAASPCDGCSRSAGAVPPSAARRAPTHRGICGRFPAAEDAPNSAVDTCCP